MELYSVKTEVMKDCCKRFYERVQKQRFRYCSRQRNGINRGSSALQVFISSYIAALHLCFLGSRVYELYTYSKDDWETKAMKYFYPKSFSNKFVKHGIRYEREAREVFISRTGFEVYECGMITSPSSPWLGYSPDGVIVHEGRPIALLEIKCLYEGIQATI